MKVKKRIEETIMQILNKHLQLDMPHPIAAKRKVVNDIIELLDNHTLQSESKEIKVNINTPFFGNTGAVIPTVKGQQKPSAEEFINEKIKSKFLPVYDKQELIEWLTEFTSLQSGKADGKSEVRDDRPEIVCICGSGRFLKEMHEVEERLTLEGKIVLMIGVNTKDVARTEDMSKYKPMLDELHLRKIDMADSVFVVNVGGYIGESTRKEILYAESKGKPIEYLAQK
jgi:hypothetical protein